MKLIDTAKAFKLVEELSFKRTKKTRVAREIYRLREQLRPAFEFMKEEDEKLRKAHPELNPQTGVVEIPGGTLEDNRAAARKIDEEFEAVHSMEWDLPENISEIVIHDGDLIDAEITGDMIGLLDGLIRFEDAEEPEVEFGGLEVVPAP